MKNRQLRAKVLARRPSLPMEAEPRAPRKAMITK